MTRPNFFEKLTETKQLITEIHRLTLKEHEAQFEKSEVLEAKETEFFPIHLSVWGASSDAAPLYHHVSC